MCGIVYVKRLDGKVAKNSVFRRYKFQKNRGQQGYGYVAIKDSLCIHVARSKEEKDIEKYLDEENVANEILFHHRMPTSTPNLIDATHPIHVRNSEVLDHEYYVVHNGIISNDDELKLEHEKKGFTYTTSVRKKYVTKTETYVEHMFNDSEALAVEIAMVLDGEKEKMEAKGSIAFIAFQIDVKTKQLLATFFGRNTSNPLKLDVEKERISITSEGKGTEIETHTLFRLNPKTNEITKKALDIGYNYLNEPSAKHSHKWDRELDDDIYSGYPTTRANTQSIIPARWDRKSRGGEWIEDPKWNHKVPHRVFDTVSRTFVHFQTEKAYLEYLTEKGKNTIPTERRMGFHTPSSPTTASTTSTNKGFTPVKQTIESKKAKDEREAREREKETDPDIILGYIEDYLLDKYDERERLTTKIRNHIEVGKDDQVIELQEELLDMDIKIRKSEEDQAIWQLRADLKREYASDYTGT